MTDTNIIYKIIKYKNFLLIKPEKKNIYIIKLNFYYNILQKDLQFSNKQINILKQIIDYLIINLKNSNVTCTNRVEDNMNAILEHIKQIKLNILI